MHSSQTQLSQPPPRDAFTRRERTIIEAHRTPRQVQRWLSGLPYNWEKNGPTLRTFRGVVEHGEAQCVEAALAATAILEQHGYPPLLLDLESQDGLDHTLFLFRHRGRFGAVARSRDAGLHGRKPVYRTLRQLVMSYADPYVDGSGRVTGFGVFDLRTLRRCDWRLSRRSVWAVERALIALRHTKFGTSDRRYERMLRRYREFRRRHPDRPATFYSSRHQWL